MKLLDEMKYIWDYISQVSGQFGNLGLLFIIYTLGLFN